MTTPERANNFRYIVLEALGILADNLGPIAAEPPADKPPSPVRLPAGRLPHGALSTAGGSRPLMIGALILVSITPISWAIIYHILTAPAPSCPGFVAPNAISYDLPAMLHPFPRNDGPITPHFVCKNRLTMPPTFHILRSQMPLSIWRKCANDGVVT